MIRRRFLQLLVGGVIGTAATLRLPGALVGKTAIGRRSACEYVRRAFNEYCDTHHGPPYMLVLEHDLYDALDSELVANQRYVVSGRLTPREAYEALMPEHMLFKGSRVQRGSRRGWGMALWGSERNGMVS